MSWYHRLLAWIGFEVEREDEQEAAPWAATSEEAPEPREAARRRNRKERSGAPVVALPGGAGSSRVVVITPRRFDDVQVVADHLKARRPVLLNLEGVDRDLSQRVVNFLSGTIYALNGEMHNVATYVLFFAPQGVDVSIEGVRAAGIPLPPDASPGSGKE